MQVKDSRFAMQNALIFMTDVPELHEVLFFVLELRAKDKRKKTKEKDFAR